LPVPASRSLRGKRQIEEERVKGRVRCERTRSEDRVRGASSRNRRHFLAVAENLDGDVKKTATQKRNYGLFLDLEKERNAV